MQSIKNKMLTLIMLLGALSVGCVQAHKELWLAHIIGDNESIMHATAKEYLCGVAAGGGGPELIDKHQNGKFHRFARVHINAAKDSYAQARHKLALLINPVLSQSSSLYNGICSQARSFVQGFKRMMFGNPCFQRSTYSKASLGTEGFMSASHTFTSKKK